MTGFLLAISFIIHIITLLSLIIVWKRSEASDRQELETMKKEMEDILYAYTTEMKEENEAFIREIKAFKQSNHNDDQSNPMVKEPNVPIDRVDPEEVEERPTYTPPILEEKEEFGVSLASKVLSMHHQGYSLEEIAKKVDKGKGEIELMLKFNQEK